MNLRRVRKKIKTVDNIHKITNAMQLVSSVKMKKAQAEYQEGKFYREFLSQMVKELSSGLKKELSPLLQEGVGDKNLYLIISTNKGLCGNFNFSLFKKIFQFIDIKNHDFVVYGKKGAEFINRVGGKILADFSTNRPQTVVLPIFDYLLKIFLSGLYKQIFIVYNQLVKMTKYEPIIEKIIPLTIDDIEKKTSMINMEYLMEPSPDVILDLLLKDTIAQRIRDAILSSQAGEHMARMMAMKNASDNAKEISFQLTLLRNKLRQEKITYELLDMVTAMESIDIKNN